MLLKINKKLTYLLYFFYSLVHAVCNDDDDGDVLLFLRFDRFQFNHLTTIFFFQCVNKNLYFHNDHSFKICLSYLSFKISNLILFFQICNFSSFYWFICFICFLRLLIFFEMTVLFVFPAQRNFNRCAFRFCHHIWVFLMFFFSLKSVIILKFINMNSLW